MAGFQVEGGRVVSAAPILKYLVGWPSQRAADYLTKKGWEYETVSKWQPE